ncbi:glycosyl hydrolase 115 family protein [Verrucomicrobiaceae bacterium N1E253]|uniref:Glycosyl hydrolase 115 family protein n=1 Tax=Oceaniferula marina TaxID=2748318 RepID=A0A851GH93_9BACT|nr:glycosyl hydrolase 115 family protein [Oceaniferula marina]NWK54497.1 glycosyl hydrolase 115 family protein [Oceaniferula marina]
MRVLTSITILVLHVVFQLSHAEPQESIPPTKTGSPLKVQNSPSKGSFPLVDAQQKAAVIHYDQADAKVVSIAAKLFSKDVQAVTGAVPKITTEESKDSNPSILIGTLGKSRAIDQLVKTGKLNAESIKGQWESFLITQIDHQLIIAGADRRGTAFGVFTLSKHIGVSPLCWWADVPPATKSQLHITAKHYREGSPSVQYRGLFINDEAMGPESLHLWAKENYEPEEGRIGPKTYAKVFELLLRLKANYCWPAMHGPSKAFNMNPQNARIADDYAIVMGTSHCEQMLRNNITEWREESMGPWNYKTNRNRIYQYWEDRIKTNKQYENTYTVGLRGTGDTEMEGTSGIGEMVGITQQALKDQRKIISDHIDHDPSKVPQILCTYKEVLEIYQHGLKVPDDITLLWADDNHGYTRQLSTPEEQKRSGGSGIYYHLSLLGTPDGYLWLSTISPTLMAYELSKAHAYGADRIWVINVGDIKPAEKELTFAMDLAWDINSWTPEKANRFIRSWAGETFGAAHAEEIADVMQEFYRLAATGKPEHVYRLEFSEQEIEQRLRDYRKLGDKAEAIAASLPKSYQSAYDHLILYPVQGCRWQNEHMLMARLSLLKASRGDAKQALDDAKQSQAATRQLDSITARYNAAGGQGKWEKMMSWWPRFHRVKPDTATPELCKQIETSTPNIRLNLAEARPNQNVRYNKETLSGTAAGGRVSIPFTSSRAGNNALWVRTTMPTYSKWSYAKSAPPVPTITGTLNGKPFSGELHPHGNRWHTAITPPTWCKLGDVSIRKGENQIEFHLSDPLIQISDIQISMVQPVPASPRFTVSAGDFTKQGKGKHSSISKLPDLGSGSGVACMPFTAPSLNDSQLVDAAWVEYSFPWSKEATHLVIRTLPNQRIHEGRGVRYAVSVDGAPANVFDVQAEEFSSEWQHNVIHGYTSRRLEISKKDATPLVVRIYLLDPGLVLQELRVE